MFARRLSRFGLSGKFIEDCVSGLGGTCALYDTNEGKLLGPTFSNSDVSSHEIVAFALLAQLKKGPTRIIPNFGSERNESDDLVLVLQLPILYPGNCI